MGIFHSFLSSLRSLIFKKFDVNDTYIECQKLNDFLLEHQSLVDSLFTTSIKFNFNTLNDVCVSSDHGTF